MHKLFNYKYNFHASQYNIEDNFTSHSSLYGKRLVLINLIHSGRDICFNCTDREILYSIKKCLKIYHGKNHAEFKESAYGKALIYKSEYLPLDPPFENIMVYFQKNYFDRLTLIEQYFATNNHNYKHLIAKKKGTIYISTDMHLPSSITNWCNESHSRIRYICRFYKMSTSKKWIWNRTQKNRLNGLNRFTIIILDYIITNTITKNIINATPKKLLILSSFNLNFTRFAI